MTFEIQRVTLVRTHAKPPKTLGAMHVTPLVMLARELVTFARTPGTPFATPAKRLGTSVSRLVKHWMTFAGTSAVQYEMPRALPWMKLAKPFATS
jgi:hypothetical protein